jgi:hypothetical protein
MTNVVVVIGVRYRLSSGAGAQKAKSDLGGIRIISPPIAGEIHRTLNKIRDAANDLADAVIELASD